MLVLIGPGALGIPAQGPEPIYVATLKYGDLMFKVTPYGTVGVTPPFFKNEVSGGRGTKSGQGTSRVEGPRAYYLAEVEKTKRSLR